MLLNLTNAFAKMDLVELIDTLNDYDQQLEKYGFLNGDQLAGKFAADQELKIRTQLADLV